MPEERKDKSRIVVAVHRKRNEGETGDDMLCAQTTGGQEQKKTLQVCGRVSTMHVMFVSTTHNTKQVVSTREIPQMVTRYVKFGLS